MTYRELITIRRNLELANNVQGAEARFLYALTKNKERIDSIIRQLNKSIEPHEDFKEYKKELDKIHDIYAEKDVRGKTLYINARDENGNTRRAYKKIDGDGIEGSEHTLAIAKLDKRYEGVISSRKVLLESYEKMLDTDIPDSEWKKWMIDLSIVPKGLPVKAMEACIHFINNIEE